MNERYTIVAAPNGILIIDTKETPYKTIATCNGWYKWENAQHICDALNSFNAPVEKIMSEAVKGTKRNVE
jgi:hypothetical protein